MQQTGKVGGVISRESFVKLDRLRSFLPVMSALYSRYLLTLSMPVAREIQTIGAAAWSEYLAVSRRPDVEASAGLRQLLSAYASCVEESTTPCARDRATLREVVDIQMARQRLIVTEKAFAEQLSLLAAQCDQQADHKPDMAKQELNVIWLGLCLSGALSLFLLWRLRGDLVRPLETAGQACLELLNKHEVRLPGVEPAVIQPGQAQSLVTGLQRLASVLDSYAGNQETLIDNAVDLICRLDSGGTIVWTNKACRSVLGCEEKDLIGRHLSDLVVAPSEPVLTTLQSLRQSRELKSFESCVLHRDGSTRDLLWSAHWSASEGMILTIAHDITRRKQAEQRLRDSEAQVNLILSSLPVGIVITDEEGVIDRVNGAFVSIQESTVADVPGKNIVELLPDLKIDSQSRLNMLTTQGALIESTFVTTSGAHKPVEVCYGQFQADDRKYWLIVIADMTARYDLERLKREFAAMVSHDLRAPLASLQTFLALLEKDRDSVGAELIAQNIKEIDRLNRLINDLLVVERMRAGKFELHMGSQKLSELVSASVSAVDQLAKARKINLVVEGCDEVVEADGARVIQVLVNLLSNALKFAPRESLITISSELRPVDNEVVIMVKDQGRGVPQSEREKIFESYVQGSPPDAGAGGHGLGLHICRVIIEQHNKRIWCTPNDPNGCVISFTLRSI